MICVTSIAHDRRHIKFIQEIDYAFNLLLPNQWEGEVDTGGRDSQESWFRVMVDEEHEDFADALVGFVSKNKDAKEDQLKKFKKDW